MHKDHGFPAVELSPQPPKPRITQIDRRLPLPARVARQKGHPVSAEVVESMCQLGHDPFLNPLNTAAITTTTRRNIDEVVNRQGREKPESRRPLIPHGGTRLINFARQRRLVPVGYKGQPRRGKGQDGCADAVPVHEF
jgi:hypothetical protein